MATFNKSWQMKSKLKSHELAQDIACIVNSQAGRSRDARLVPVMGAATIKPAKAALWPPWLKSKPLQFKPQCSEAPPIMQLLAGQVIIKIDLLLLEVSAAPEMLACHLQC